MTGAASTTPTSRTQTRFGSVTRVPLMPLGEPDGAGPGKLRSGNLKPQRRPSEKPVRLKSDIKKSMASLVDEKKFLLGRIAELTAKLEERMPTGDHRNQWSKSTQESSEAEFVLEEQRISERESFKSQIAAMKERMQDAESELQSCRSTLESLGVSAISFQRIDDTKRADVDDLETKLSAIGDEIALGRDSVRALLSEIQSMFTGDDLDCLFNAADDLGSQVVVN